MFDEKHRPALVVEGANPVEETVGERGVDPGGGFVEQEERGVEHQHPAEFEEFALAARQPACVLLGEVVQVEEVEGVGHALVERGLLRGDDGRTGERAKRRLAGLVRGGEREVGGDAHPGEQFGRLERPADARGGDGVWRTPDDILAPQPDAAGVGGEHARHEVEQCRLPRTVGADEPRDGALGHRERRPVDGGQPPERLDEVIDGECGRVGHSSSPASTSSLGSPNSPAGRNRTTRISSRPMTMNRIEGRSVADPPTSGR